MRLPVSVLESEHEEGSRWKVSVLTEGPSKNLFRGVPIYYPPETLAKVVERVDGIPAYIYQAGEAGLDHLPETFRQEREGGLVGNLIGWYEKPRLERIGGKLHIVADLYVHKGASGVRRFLKDAWARGKELGVSIVADAVASLRRIAGQVYACVEDLEFVSADPVAHPATGARFLALLESTKAGHQTDLPQEEVSVSENNVDKLLMALAGELAPGPAAADSSPSGPAHDLVSTLIESLDPNTFPQADVRERLTRIKSLLESGDLQSAAKGLGELLTEPKKASGELEEKAGSEIEEKLRELLKLIEAGDIEGALKLLKAMLEERYPVPGVKADGEPYPKPVKAAEEAPVEVTMTDGTKTLQERLAALEAAVAELVRLRREESAKAKIREEVQARGLPEPAEARVLQRFFSGPTVELTEDRITEAVKEESEYLDQLLGTITSQVVGMGCPAPLSVAESEKTLVEFFDAALGVKKEVTRAS